MNHHPAERFARRTTLVVLLALASALPTATAWVAEPANPSAEDDATRVGELPAGAIVTLARADGQPADLALHAEAITVRPVDGAERKGVTIREGPLPGDVTFVRFDEMRFDAEGAWSFEPSNGQEAPATITVRRNAQG